MVHLKCSPCRIRVTAAKGPDEHLARFCPKCDAPLVPAAALSELVGFRRLEAPAELVPGVDAAVGFEHWLDAGEAFLAQAIALPKPNHRPPPASTGATR